VKEETTYNRLLIQKDYQEFEDTDETQTGTPSSWCLYKNSVLLFNSVPDDNNGSDYSIRIRYWKLSTTMVNDEDLHDLPARMERGIRLKATAFTMGILNMEEKQMIKEKEFDRWLQRIDLPTAGSKRRNKRAQVDMARRR
jgi:hypothetical protein